MALIEEFEKQGTWLFRYRGVLPLVILLIGGGVFAYAEYYHEQFFLKNIEYKRYWELFCLAVCLFGFWIRVYTIGYTPRFTSGRNVKAQLAETLNTKGIYSIVRHPLYLGNFFMWLGIALLIGHIWFVVSFCLFYWVYYERIMFAEEQFLRKKFGEAYTEWADKVPAFFPKMRGFVKPDISFSFKKVLRKEKNGFAAIFLIFALFDIGGEQIGLTAGYNYPLIAMAIFSVVLYLVLKILKQYTSVLNEEGR